MLLVVSLKVSIIDVKRTDMKRSNNADNYRDHKTTNDFVYYDPHVYINSESD